MPVTNAGILGKMKYDEIVRADLTRYLLPHFVEKVMSQDVAIDLDGEFTCKEHPSMAVKGKGDKMEVFEALY